MRCKAQRDGLIGTSYIHEGEEFEVEKCPNWAVPVKKSRPEDDEEKAGK